jgi:hypothetical protein
MTRQAFDEGPFWLEVARSRDADQVGGCRSARLAKKRHLHAASTDLNEEAP